MEGLINQECMTGGSAIRIRFQWNWDGVGLLFKNCIHAALFLFLIHRGEGVGFAGKGYGRVFHNFSRVEPLKALFQRVRPVSIRGMITQKNHGSFDLDKAGGGGGGTFQPRPNFRPGSTLRVETFQPKAGRSFSKFFWKSKRMRTHT
jgi:hypothetical protein